MKRARSPNITRGSIIEHVAIVGSDCARKSRREAEHHIFRILYDIQLDASSADGMAKGKTILFVDTTLGDPTFIAAYACLHHAKCVGGRGVGKHQRHPTRMQGERYVCGSKRRRRDLFGRQAGSRATFAYTCGAEHKSCNRKDGKLHTNSLGAHNTPRAVLLACLDTPRHNLRRGTFPLCRPRAFPYPQRPPAGYAPHLRVDRGKRVNRGCRL